MSIRKERDLIKKQAKLSSRIVKNSVKYHARFFDHWREWSTRITQVVIRLNAGGRVYVFGSVVTGNVTGASDVDILIILPSVPRSGKERAAIIEQIEDGAKIPLIHPFEFHLVDPKEAKWYFSLGATFWDPLANEVVNL